MQLYAYRNTEAHARFNHAPAPVEQKVSIFELKRMRAEQDANERERQLAAQREQANAAIRKANEALRKFNATGRSFEQIAFTICRVLKVTRNELMSNRRNKRVVFARQAIMYWSMRLSKLSSPEIGRRLGGLDHTTILHGKEAYPAKRAAMGRHLREAR